MALEIRTQPAILAIRSTNAQVSIEQPKAAYNGSISFAKVQVESTLPKITIDQTAAFSESGLKTNTDFLADNVNKSKQIAQEGVGRNAAQGNQLQRIHTGENAIKNIAIENSISQFLHEFGMVTMPTSKPEINVIEGATEVQVIEGEITGGYIQQKPIINIQPGNIQRYMEQYNSISIRYIGENVDISV